MAGTCPLLNDGDNLVIAQRLAFQKLLHDGVIALDGTLDQLLAVGGDAVLKIGGNGNLLHLVATLEGIPFLCHKVYDTLEIELFTERNL